ncbi:hypothetical protein SLS59_002798 [Nothophoma quercina]|uniref:Uncharacterized protein n=1 Tax=Nothophoma quercina TaxID=749835 RepID=A0ABR3RSL8_9PLEO
MSYHLPIFHQAVMPHNSRIKEYSRDHRAWIQDGKKFRNIKSSKAFIWPKDGKNGSKWGRMKDILQDKGPDIHIAISADRMDYMQNRQHKSRWSDWTCLDDRDRDVSMSSTKYAPWTHNGALGGRVPGLSYDFRTRKYGKPNKYTWTDIKWQAEPNAKHVYPEAFRSFCGDWYQDQHYVPLTRRYPY